MVCEGLIFQRKVCFFLQSLEPGTTFLSVQSLMFMWNELEEK